MKRFLTAAAAMLALGLLGACSTSTPRGSAEQALTRPAAERIRWPERYRPDKALFFVHNEIEIQAPPQVVWAILQDVEAWPQWYSGAKDIKLIGSKSGKLEAAGAFTLNTMGLKFIAQVKEFEPPYRLATENRKLVIQGYHAWLIVPTKTGCKFITDESFRGFLAVMQRTFIPNKLHRLHEEFVVELKRKAESQVRGKQS
jgi:ribosome-associated toxin RatA of RatAB toxin-antitoxin module